MASAEQIAPLTNKVKQLSHQFGVLEDIQSIRTLHFKYGYYMGIVSQLSFVVLTKRFLINSQSQFLVTTFPIVDVNRPAPAPKIFPQIADGEGYLTEFVLQNVSKSSG